MAHIPQQDDQNREIDLSQISRIISRTYQGFLGWAFRQVQFVLKNIVILAGLIVIGFGIGYLMDATTKSYQHKILVTPNFGSVDYLYSQVELVESKLREGDTAFFRSIGIARTQDISKIEIKPIVDVYNFVSNRKNVGENMQSTPNFELLKLMSEKSDINEVIKDEVTGRNYDTHLIQIRSSAKLSAKEVIEPLMQFLNHSDFYQSVQTQYRRNLELKIEKNEQMIGQINSILTRYSSENAGKENNRMFYYSENTELNDIISTKNALILEQGDNRLSLNLNDRIIKEKSRVLNIESSAGLNGRRKFVVPMLLLCLFVGITAFISFFRTQRSKYAA